MPSQDAQPDTTQYAYPAYWSADFSTCVHARRARCCDVLVLFTASAAAANVTPARQ
jgi:hypothetical protein